MRPNQAYFYRNRGPWDWQVQFELVSWAALWGADISLFSKFCLSMLVLVQRYFGPLQMWTYVDFQESANIVCHSTKMKKYGLTVYRSEKRFFLDENGNSIRLEGKEYFCPFSFIGFAFKPTTGSVNDSTTRAFYRMPMAGTQCDCHAFLELPEGHIAITSPWLKGRFSLSKSSNKTLQERFEQK